MDLRDSLKKALGRKRVNEWIKAGLQLETALKTLPVWQQRIFRQLEKSIDKAHGIIEGKEFDAALMGTFAGQIAASSQHILRKEPGEKAAPPAAKKFLRTIRRRKDVRSFLRQLAQELPCI
jgi:hypothetical protein